MISGVLHPNLFVFRTRDCF